MKTCIALFGLLVCLVVADALAQKGGLATASAPASGAGPVRFEMRKLHREYGNDCLGGRPGGNENACVWIDIRYPEVLFAPNRQAKTKITQVIQHWVLAEATDDPDRLVFGNLETVVQEFIDREKKAHAEEGNYVGWWFKRDVKIEYESANVLSLSCEKEGWQGGQDHWRLDYASLRPSTGERIRLRDILKPGFEQPLNSLAEVRFRALLNLDREATLSEGGFWFPNDQFSLNANFLINAKGLTFQYYEFEVSCYACGAPSVFLPYSDLRDLLRPDAHIP